jgi:hypothetical protein
LERTVPEHRQTPDTTDDSGLTGPERAALIFLVTLSIFGGAAATLPASDVRISAAPSISAQFAGAFEAGVQDPLPEIIGSIGPRPTAEF